jgi:hypothetical protein
MKPMLANPLWRVLHVLYTSVQWYDQSAVGRLTTRREEW